MALFKNIFGFIVISALETLAIGPVLWGCVWIADMVVPGTATPPLWLLVAIPFCLVMLVGLKNMLEEQGDSMPTTLAFLGHVGVCLVVGLIASVPVFAFMAPKPLFTVLWAAVAAMLFLVSLVWGLWRRESLFWYEDIE